MTRNRLPLSDHPSGPVPRAPWRRRSTYALAVLVTALAATLLVVVRPTEVGVGDVAARVASGPPRSSGYFVTRKVGSWSSLPSGAACAGRVHRSTWEPRPDNTGANHRMPSVRQVHQAFRARPVVRVNRRRVRGLRSFSRMSRRTFFALTTWPRWRSSAPTRR